MRRTLIFTRITFVMLAFVASSFAQGRNVPDQFDQAKRHTASISSITFSPDGKQLATGSSNATARFFQDLADALGLSIEVAIGSYDGTASLWDAKTGEHIYEWKSVHGWDFGHVESVAFSPNGEKIAIATYSAGVQLLDAKTGEPIRELNTGSVDSVVFSRNGKQIATGGYTTGIWNVDTGKKIREFRQGNADSVAFSPNGKQIATIKVVPHRSGGPLGVRIRYFRNLRHGARIRELHIGDASDVAFSPNWKQLVTNSNSGGSVRLWNANTGKKIREFKTRIPTISVAFSPNGKQIAAILIDGSVRLYNANTGKLIRTFKGDTMISSMAFSPDGKQIAIGSVDGSFRLRKLLKQNPDMELDIEIVGVGAAPTAGAQRPAETALLANFPNPFNPETWIPYKLAMDTDVRITIYASNGVVVRTLELGHQLAGYYTGRARAAYWDGRNTLGEPVVSGVYFYQFETDTMSSMRKMVILK